MFMTLNALKIKEIQNKLIECKAAVIQLWFEAQSEMGSGGKTTDQQEFIGYCEVLREFIRPAVDDLLFNVDTATEEELKLYATQLTKFFDDARPLYEEDRFKRILHLAKTHGVLHPWLRPIYQLLSQVVSALCGIMVGNETTLL